VTADPVQAEVRETAHRLVAAFGSHDTEAYFGFFSPDATFVFHNHPEILAGRGQYEAVWRTWEETGFRVLGCRSLDSTVRMLDDATAIFTHRVRTELDGEPEPLRERETIVFQRTADGWLAVYEHLSPEPDDSGEGLP
jgi:ketosteroid isomerase-like protein